MLEFTCVSCGKRIQGDETLTGKRVQCPACDVGMTFPALPSARPLASISGPTGIGEGPPPSPEPILPREMAPHIARRWTPWLIAGVFAVVAIGLLIPAVQRMREAAMRTQSISNLKQIAMACQSFHDANRRLPYNGTVNPYKYRGMKVGGPAIGGDGATGSWAFMILPYLDQQALFNTRDPGKGVATFMCPARGRPTVCTGDPAGAWTDYFLNSFLNDPNGNPDAPDRRLKLADITDGSSWTILAGHGQIIPSDYSAAETIPGYTDVIFNGGSAATCRPNRVINLRRDAEDSQPGDWGGPFPQGALVVMCDGCVRFIPYTVTGGAVANGVGIPAGGFAPYLTPTGKEPTACGSDT